MRTADRSGSIKVSVIMGVYNQWDRAALCQAVDSILNQTLEELEFIICDDGSAPEVGLNIQQLSYRDPRIRICENWENHGLAFSLNKCIGLSRGCYLARMDADDLSAPDRLRRQYEFLEGHPEYGWCGTNAWLFNGNVVWGSRQMQEEPAAIDYLKYSPFIHPTVMFRRQLLIEHLYAVVPETRRCEDYELFLRLEQLGFHGYNLQEPLFYYREDQESLLRRTMHARMSEAKVRLRKFWEMRLLFPVGWIYVLRPIVGGLVPDRLIAWMKWRESGYGGGAVDQAAAILPEAVEEEFAALSGVD